jgi:hypothetical protein
MGCLFLFCKSEYALIVGTRMKSYRSLRIVSSLLEAILLDDSKSI